MIKPAKTLRSQEDALYWAAMQGYHTYVPRKETRRYRQYSAHCYCEETEVVTFKNKNGDYLHIAICNVCGNDL